MHRSPSVNSVLSTGAGIGPNSGFQIPNSDPPTPSSPSKVKEKIPFEDVHELLEEPVEEQVGQQTCKKITNTVTLLNCKRVTILNCLIIKLSSCKSVT
jgi:hypothetical protein